MVLPQKGYSQDQTVNVFSITQPLSSDYPILVHCDIYVAYDMIQMLIFGEGFHWSFYLNMAEFSLKISKTVLFTLQEAEIKKMAKSGNREACKILAKQLVQLRKQKNRTYAVSSKVTSMSTQTKVMNSQMKMAGAMATSAKVRPRYLSFIYSHMSSPECLNLQLKMI